VTDEKTGPDKPSVAKTFGIVAVLTVASKFVGLLRDIVVASAYGTSVIADAYNYALMFSGNILVLFGGLGGPFHSSTVTILTPKKDDRDCGQLMSQIAALTFAILTAITLLCYLLAPLLTPFLGANYKPTNGGTIAGEQLAAMQLLFQQQFLTQLQFMLPLVVLAGLVGVSYGILNVYNKIFWPSLSPAIASVAIIVAIAVSDNHTRLITGVPLAVGTLVGAIGQFLAQLPAIAKLNLNWSLKLKPQPGLGEYASMLWPAFFSTSVGTLTVYVDSCFALQVPTQGAWTAIVSSNRLVQLPLGILLTAMLVPILPRFTEQASQEKFDDLKAELRRALKVLWFLALPMTAILLALPQQIINVLFKRGHFDETSSALVTLALVFLVPSIFFYVARDLMTRVFYAFQDSKTPYYVAVMAIIVKAALDWLFVMQIKLGVAGISAATTLITIFNLGLLTFFLRRKIGRLGLTLLIKPLLIMITASAACAGIVILLYPYVFGLTHISHWWWQLIALAVASLSGLSIYLGTCLIFRLEEPMIMARRIPVLRNMVESQNKDR
jgi:putative peptidoglycan lipid II flippase